MKSGRLTASLGLVLLACSFFVAPARAAQPECRSVSGRFVEYVADTFLSPNDPFGRVVNFARGSINSIGTGILTSLGPGPTPGTLSATTRHLFVINEEDQIIATGVAVFTPSPGSVNVGDVLTLTIQGGLGRYKSATGTIVATGTGFNFFPLPPGPTAGSAYFIFDYKGNVCGVTEGGGGQ